MDLALAPALVLLALVVVVVLAARTTRGRDGGCCAPADPSRDLRMREPGDAEPRSGRPHG